MNQKAIFERIKITEGNMNIILKPLPGNDDIQYDEHLPEPALLFIKRENKLIMGRTQW